MFRINSSLPVLLLNSLNQVNRLTATSLERLSTGLRINRAADNPAGLVVSEGLGALIASLEQANENATNANNLLQTAESALGEIDDILVRLKELAIEAADTSISDAERSAIQDEAAQLLEEIDRIAETTEFNDIQLLASTQNFTFFVGTGVAGVDETISVQLPASQASEFIAGVTSASIATSANSAALASLDLGIESVNLQRGPHRRGSEPPGVHPLGHRLQAGQPGDRSVGHPRRGLRRRDGQSDPGLHPGAEQRLRAGAGEPVERRHAVAFGVHLRTG
ncbi:MAG: hypothetical protein KatS3mg115_1037 [Candidatus Poribacteria bacterium]|nr:MAG: hypothetical protein KatS3mg115_1037 [Candidatus Poribacteria bacterium]